MLRRLLASWLLALAVPLVAAADPEFVVVDPSLRFVTVYLAVPPGLTKESRAALENYVHEHDGAYMEPWRSFVADVRRNVTSHIRKNEYPEVDCAESIILLLHEFELEEIGLTWNGGVAVTSGAYAFAEKTYEAYTRDPAFVGRPWDGEADPVHPWNQTGPLLHQRPAAGWPS